MDRRARGMVRQLPAPQHPHGERALGIRPIAVSSTSGTTLSSTTSGVFRRVLRGDVCRARRPDLATSVAGASPGAGGISTRTPTAASTTAPYVPLVEMFPGRHPGPPALDARFGPAGASSALGRRLRAPARRGHLIVGSGFTTHNLLVQPRAGADGTHPPVSGVRPLGCRAMVPGTSTACSTSSPRPPLRTRPTRAPSTGSAL